MKGKKKIKLSKLEEEKISGGKLKKKKIFTENSTFPMMIAYGGPNLFDIDKKLKKIDSFKKSKDEKENNIIENFSEEE